MGLGRLADVGLQEEKQLGSMQYKMDFVSQIKSQIQDTEKKLSDLKELATLLEKNPELKRALDLLGETRGLY